MKSESIEKRIICTPTANGYDISEVETYNIKKIDKGCVIVNSESTWIKRSMPTHFTTVIIHPIWGENRLKTA